MVNFINDNGAVFINIGGINPPSLTEATRGINARPIIANEPIAGEGNFFDVDVITTPLTAPGGGLSLVPILPITNNPNAIGISDFEPFERDLSSGELTSIGEVDYRTFPLFQYGANSSDNNFNPVEVPTIINTQRIVEDVNNELLEGDLGDDQLNGFLGNDTIFGSFGNDSLFGGQGDDILNGNEGNDILSGDYGQDILTGGLDRDTFIFSKITATFDINQVDIITDFIVGEDQIKLVDGSNIYQINLVSTILFETVGTLVVDTPSNLILGFVSNVPAEALWNSIDLP
ncbi:MAG: hypothetical protein WBA77_18650 [Microcoleaceae cyanobacterium]